MNKIITQLNNISHLDRKIFWGLFSCLLFFVISYAYLVNQTILNIVERENVEESIITLSSDISEMEFEYISLKNDINLAYAHSIGFVDVVNVKFASRRLAGQSLSLRSE